MHLGDFRETAESVRLNAQDFVCCQIQDNEIPQIPQMLLVYVNYEILLQV